MKTYLFSVILSLTVVACGGEDEQPDVSCVGALSHYYQVGCAYFDEFGEIPLIDMIGDCQTARATSGASCQPALDDWLICLEEAPGNDCDCNAEFERALQAGCVAESMAASNGSLAYP